MKRPVLVYALLTFIFNSRCCWTAKIIFLYYPSYSHHVGPVNVAKLLKDQGHEVLVAVPPQLQPSLEDKGVKLLLYHGLGDFSERHMGTNIILRNYFEGKNTASSDAIVALTNVTTKIMKDATFLEDIKNFHPDLMVLDSAPISAMLTYISYKLDIPFIFIGLFFIPQYARSPILPSVIPNEMYPVISYTDHMTFQQRLINTFLELLTYWFNPLVNTTFVREYLAEKPYISLRDLQAKSPLWLIQHHGVLDYNQPISPNVKRVGGLLPRTARPLSPEFQSFMDDAREGVILVAFGSVLKAIPAEILNKFLKAFEQTQYKYILQVSSPGRRQSDKFMFKPWIPQYDLLHNERTKLFVTHCGLNSLHEAMLAGVPMLGFPVFSDQPQNAGKLVRKGFGLRLDLRSFKVQELVSAITEVVNNRSYKDNVQKASAILKSERMSSVEEAGFWINHVLAFGGDHLRSHAQDIPFWKYFGLDIFLFCFLLWHVFLFLMINVLRFLFSYLYRRTKKHKRD
ncbi:UDP-glucuronosyltransferase 2B14-like [Dendronephthya gigantea]|uniref:UDP-glucuronosyltransferase 2B14-like n=1 Tax=Dendronephthya gigantea TaxID=151771 RepID=UPI00106C9226|nr:UDP-glucuronosyltransferase 2B14-like [Dendronephthya gigantea]